MMKSILLLLVSLSLVVGLQAADIDEVHNKEKQKIDAASKSQVRVDETFEQTEKLFEKFQVVSKEVEGLKVYNAQLRHQIDDQKKQLQDLDDSIDQVTVIERQITPLTLRMIDTLEKFVELDLPFHLEERQERVRLLRNNFDKSNITIAEKFRQVLEAYKIEREYGRKIDRYTETISYNGSEMDVKVLRIGRVALLFQTADKNHYGYWDNDNNQWQALDESDYKRSIDQGLRMASKQAAVDLLTVPLHAPGKGKLTPASNKGGES